MLLPRVIVVGNPGAARHEVNRGHGVLLEWDNVVPHDSRPPQEWPMDEDAPHNVLHVALQGDKDPLVLTEDSGLVAQPLAYTSE